MVTAFVLLYPEFALGALLVLGTLDELDELLVVLIEHSTNIELLAGHSLMELHLTLQAIDLRAERAGELSVALVEVEHVLAAC